MIEKLPVLDILPQLTEALDRHGIAVLTAPPGTGKSTALPPELIKLANGKKIIILEPRRAAAKTVAARIAWNMHEKVGRSVGWRIRNETVPGTEIEVVTEGILIRMLQHDPELTQAGIVIFDEFHERSLITDLSLALTFDVRKSLRPDLKILIMSATMDGCAAAEKFNAPFIEAHERMYQVKTLYQPRPATEDAPLAAARAALNIMREEPGSALIFLPGAAEIGRACEFLHEYLPQDTDVFPLYGALSGGEQERAIAPAEPGRRKIVVATNLAETSLTIEGVRIVVDSGLQKKMRFSPVSGMSRLETVRISRASANQRRGRAGRTEEGICIRLWSEAENTAMLQFDPPEILDADLARFTLELAAWGAKPEELMWLDNPPAPALKAAGELLAGLNIISPDGALTACGRRAVELPLHPRLGIMMVRAAEIGLVPLACEVAAILESRCISDNDDLGEQIYSSRSGGYSAGRIRDLRNQLLQLMKVRMVEQNPADCGRILAFAYPDRAGKARKNNSELFLLSGGRGVRLNRESRLRGNEFIIAAEVDDASENGLVRRGAAITLEQLKECAPQLFTHREKIFFDQEKAAVYAVSEECMGAVVLASVPMKNPDRQKCTALLIDAIRKNGLAVLEFSPRLEALIHRTGFAHRQNNGDYPSLDGETLTRNLESWLAPYLDGLNSIAQIKKLDLYQIMINYISWSKFEALNRDYPERFVTPAGSALKIDYSGDTPRISARIQEFYGCQIHPTVGKEHTPLIIELLSPAMRPVQVTTDLPGFWTGNWPIVMKEMKGRYPKHVWPEHPENAMPTTKTKAALKRELEKK